MESGAAQRALVRDSFVVFSVWLLVFIILDVMLNIIFLEAWSLFTKGELKSTLVRWRPYVAFFLVKATVAPQYPMIILSYLIMRRFKFSLQAKNLVMMCIFTAFLGYMFFFWLVVFKEFQGSSAEHDNLAELIRRDMDSWFRPSGRVEFIRHSSLLATFVAAPIVTWVFHRLGRV